MKFEKPAVKELTLLERMCQEYGAKLDITEERVMNTLANAEIGCILMYELRKAKVKERDRINMLTQRLDKQEQQYLAVETSGNGELCMKLLSDSEYTKCLLDDARAYLEYLNTLGR